MEACSRALDQVIAAVRAAGVEPPRLATGELSVHPDWEVSPDGQQRPAGYRAAVQLTARLDAPARAGQVATAAVTAGGEAARVHGLALVVGDQAGVSAAAREGAWRDARGRAEQYAALAGVALGGVLRIEEVAGARHALPLAGRYEAQAAAGPAVEVGEAEVGRGWPSPGRCWMHRSLMPVSARSHCRSSSHSVWSPSGLLVGPPAELRGVGGSATGRSSYVNGLNASVTRPSNPTEMTVDRKLSLSSGRRSLGDPATAVTAADLDRGGHQP